MSFRILLVALFGVGVSYLALVGQIELDPWSASDSINSRTLPQIYGVLLCLAVFALAMGQRDLVKAPSPIAKGKITRLVKLCALISAFIISLPWLNLWVALAALLFGGLLTMGEKRWSVICALSLGLPMTGFVFVERVLQMTVPLS